MDILTNKEYIADVSRFLIELAQIDPTKLSLYDRIDYYILYSKLEQIQYVTNDIRPWEWDPLLVIDEIYQGLFLVSDLPNIRMNDRVEAALGRLKLIPEMLVFSKEIKATYKESSHLVKDKNSFTNPLDKPIKDEKAFTSRGAGPFLLGQCPILFFRGHRCVG